MDIKMLRSLAYAGIVLALVLSIWYTGKTYEEGNPKWIYLIMVFGIAIMLTTGLFGKRRR